MNKKKQSKKKKKEVEEEVVVEEVKVPKTFKDFFFVKNLIGMVKECDVLKYLSEELLMPDYQTDLSKSIKLEYYTHSVVFAIENYFTVEKAIYFFCLMEEILAFTHKDGVCVEECIALAKDKVTELSTKCVRKGIEIVEDPELKEKQEKKSEEQSSHQSGKKSKKKKKKKGGSKPGSRASGSRAGSSKEKEEGNGLVKEEGEGEGGPASAVMRNAVFNRSECEKVSEFVAKGLLSHFHLYRNVFRNTRPKKFEKQRPVVVEPFAPIALKLMLEKEEYGQKVAQAALEKQREEEKSEEEKRSEEVEKFQIETKVEEEEDVSALSGDDLVDISNFLKLEIASKEEEEKEEEYSQRLESLKKKIDGLML